MKLTIDQFAQLQSAGFTDRQITTLQEKFYCLLETVPLPDPVHVQNIESLSQQLSTALDEARMANVSADEVRSTYAEEMRKLSKQLADMTKERDKAKAMPMRYRRMEFNAQLQDENESLRQQLSAMTAERDAYIRDYGEEQDRKREVAQRLSAAQADAKTAWEKAGEACTAHAESIKREVMLRDSLKHIASGVKANGCLSTVDYCVDIADEALAATADLKGLRLCHAKEVGEVNRYGRNSAGKPWHGASLKEDGSIDLPSGTLLFTAWEQTKWSVK